jgi:hypothetical protein
LHTSQVHLKSRHAYRYPSTFHKQFLDGSGGRLQCTKVFKMEVGKTSLHNYFFNGSGEDFHYQRCCKVVEFSAGKVAKFWNLVEPFDWLLTNILEHGGLHNIEA